MAHQTISTKDLREQLPRVRRELARGQSYTIIYRSRPIAHLEPLRAATSSKARVKGGSLRLQGNTTKRLTPEYLNQLAENKYE